MYSLQLLSTTTSSDSVDISTMSEMTDGVTSIAQAIYEYGYVIVLMSIFFIIFLALFLFMMRSNAKMVNQVISRQASSDDLDQQIITKFVENALDAQANKDKHEVEDLIKDFQQTLKPIEDAIRGINDAKEQEESYHKDLVGSHIDVNIAFKDASRKTLNALNCNRIAIYVFHNGNKSMHGLPFFKMSCIHEWHVKGVNTLRGKSHTDMPLHMFSDFIEDLWTSGVYKSENVEKSSNTDESISEFVAFSNAKALYIVGIKDDNDVLTGFIVAEFDDIDTFESDEIRNNEVYSTIQDMNNRISAIVTHKYIYKK